MILDISNLKNISQLCNKYYSNRNTPSKIRDNSNNNNNTIHQNSDYLKIKSELVLVKNELNNYKNQNIILTKKNQNLKNLLCFNKNKCNILKKNFNYKMNLYKNKSLDYNILDKITLCFHSLINHLLDILEVFVFNKSLFNLNDNSFAEELLTDIKNKLINKLQIIESANYEWLDGLNKEINRIKNWNELYNLDVLNKDYKSKSMNHGNIYKNREKSHFLMNISRVENKSSDKFRTTKETNSIDEINSLKYNNSSSEIQLRNFQLKTYLIKKPKKKTNSAKKAPLERTPTISDYYLE